MKAWKKGLTFLIILIGLNFSVIPAIIPNMQASTAKIRDAELKSTMDMSVPAVGVDYVWSHFQDPGGDWLTGKGIVVGIVDTGIDWKHPDFYNPDWTKRVKIIPGFFQFYAADLNNDSLAQPNEDLYEINSADGPAGWDPYYDWLFVDRVANMAYDYGDWYALPMDEDGQGDLDFGETVVMLTSSKINKIIDMTTGLNWTKADIESSNCASFDLDGHGTHVAGILAGGQLKQDGTRFHSHTGVAPGARLIVCKYDDYGSYNDTWLYKALKLITSENIDVLCLSLGGYIWRHLDGTSAIEQLIDNLTIPVVVAAGNLRNKWVHQEETVVPGSITTVPFHVNQFASEPQEIRLSVVWDQPSTLLDFNLSYYGPIGGWYIWPGPGPLPPIPWPTIDNISLPSPGPALQTVFFPSIGLQVDYWLNASARTNLLCINITPGFGAILFGTYSLEIFNAPGDVDVQCYVWDNSNQWKNTTVIFPPFMFPSWVLFGFEPLGPGLDIAVTATPEYTVTHPATATNAIAVGSFNVADGTLSEFSSIGSPNYTNYMNGYEKPDLCAPGSDTNTYGINSSVSRNVTGSNIGQWTSHISNYSGTSQAAPHVAGTVALLLQKNSLLNISQIKTILRQTTNRTGVGSVPNHYWGYGRLNIRDAVTHLYPSVEPGPILPWWAWVIIISAILIVLVIIIIKRKKKKDVA